MTKSLGIRVSSIGYLVRVSYPQRREIGYRRMCGVQSFAALFSASSLVGLLLAICGIVLGFLALLPSIAHGAESKRSTILVTLPSNVSSPKFKSLLKEFGASQQPTFPAVHKLVQAHGARGAGLALTEGRLANMIRQGKTVAPKEEISTYTIERLANTFSVRGVPPKKIPQFNAAIQTLGGTATRSTVARLLDIPQEGTTASQLPGCVPPGTNGFLIQWGLNNTGQPIRDLATPGCTAGVPNQDIDMIEAWQARGGFATGRETVTVAVIDTGFRYDAHTDLKRSVWINQGEIPATVRAALDTNNDGFVANEEFLAVYPNIRAAIKSAPLKNEIDEDGNGYVDDIIGFDMVHAFPPEWTTWYGETCYSGEDCNAIDNDPYDIDGHGTQVSSVVAATPNNGTGIAGIAAGVKVIAIKAGFMTRDQSGNTQTYSTDEILANSVLYAIAAGADIINLSWGSPDPWSPSAVTALAAAHEAGVVIVGGAGNDATIEPSYPAAHDHVVSAGSIGHRGLRSGYSNYGPTIDLGAPGEAVLSIGLNGSVYYSFGTSFSSPYTAAVFAFLKSAYPCLNHDSLTELVLGYTRPYLPGVEQLGSGFLNAYLPLEAAEQLGYCRSKSPDINTDGRVDGIDLAMLLAAWGGCPMGQACGADLNGDRFIDALDKSALLDSWGSSLLPPAASRSRS